MSYGTKGLTLLADAVRERPLLWDRWARQCVGRCTERLLARRPPGSRSRDLSTEPGRSHGPEPSGPDTDRRPQEVSGRLSGAKRRSCRTRDSSGAPFPRDPARRRPWNRPRWPGRGRSPGAPGRCGALWRSRDGADDGARHECRPMAGLVVWTTGSSGEWSWLLWAPVSSASRGARQRVSMSTTPEDWGRGMGRGAPGGDLVVHAPERDALVTVGLPSRQPLHLTKAPLAETAVITKTAVRNPPQRRPPSLPRRPSPERTGQERPTALTLAPCLPRVVSSRIVLVRLPRPERAPRS
jgi:hypothetical protein